MVLARNSLEMRLEKLGQDLEKGKEDYEGLAKTVCNKDETIASWKLKAVRKVPCWVIQKLEHNCP